MPSLVTGFEEAFGVKAEYCECGEAMMWHKYDPVSGSEVLECVKCGRKRYGGSEEGDEDA